MSQVNTIKNSLKVFLGQAFLIPACAICSAMHQVRLTEAKNSIFPRKCPSHSLLEISGGGALPPTLRFLKSDLKCQTLNERGLMPIPRRKWKVSESSK